MTEIPVLVDQIDVGEGVPKALKTPKATVELKECQECHQIFPRDEFRKRKDRQGEMNWVIAYCNKCHSTRISQSRNKKKEKYKKYGREHFNNYYHTNKDKVRIVQKRYYYNKLPSEKQSRYKQKVENTWPEWVELICGK